MSTKVLNFGSLNLDYVYTVDHFVQAGETLSSSDLGTFCGGKGLNQSVALAKAGCETYHAGAVGQGDSKILLDMLAQAGVNLDYIKSVDGPSGHAIIQNNKEGNNCILLFGGANRQIQKKDIYETLSHFGEGDYLVLQNEISELNTIMEEGHKRGMKIVLNPSPMDETILNAPLHLVDTFLLNEVEAAAITGKNREDEEALLQGLQERFPNAKVVLTLGDRGSAYCFEEQVFHQKIYSVQAVDTTAAGDTFTGFFLGAIIQGKTVEEALDLAAKAAAIAVSKKGAAPSIPTLAEVLAW